MDSAGTGRENREALGAVTTEVGERIALCLPLDALGDDGEADQGRGSPNAPSATTSANSRPSATRSPSSPSARSIRRANAMAIRGDDGLRWVYRVRRVGQVHRTAAPPHPG